MTEKTRPIPADFFSDWKEREALSESMIPLIGSLYREKNISLYMYGKSMVNKSVIELMKAHRFVRQIEQNELSEYETFPLIETLSNINLGPAHIDVGKLAVKYQESNNANSLVDFLNEEIGEELNDMRKPIPNPQDVVLYGFGRIGRLLARLLLEKTGSGDMLRLRAIVVRGNSNKSDLFKRASLLRRDSVHGAFEGTIRILKDKNILVCNGNPIQIIYANSPDEIDYKKLDIDNAILIDNTGAWRDEEGLLKHIDCPGVDKVILTAPGKDPIPNIVYGINHSDITEKSKIISAASCTTNAIVPILKAIQDEYGIKSGHVETVHSYTNDQNLIDNYHKGSRRGRSAPLNMVLTETGAADAVSKALPELKDKLTGSAIRVPTPNVSMAILNLRLNQETSLEHINDYVRKMSLHSSLQNQIDYTKSTEAVSSDFIGSRHACIYDAQATIVDRDNVILYCWYDNEFGYSCQVIRCLEEFAGINWKMIP
ncbi:MAG: glyceraldehyde-3-phosphate dehydrogenase [Porticoccus sp.]|nr:glyceraldehyde-3-phosphate dehydrogenase [Porticoccus sp.]